MYIKIRAKPLEENLTINKKVGSSRIKPEAVLLCFFLQYLVFFFLAPAGGSNPAGQSITLNQPNLTLPNINYQKLLRKYEETRLLGLSDLIPKVCYYCNTN